MLRVRRDGGAAVRAGARVAGRRGAGDGAGEEEEFALGGRLGADELGALRVGAVHASGRAEFAGLGFKYFDEVRVEMWADGG